MIRYVFGGIFILFSTVVFSQSSDSTKFSHHYLFAGIGLRSDAETTGFYKWGPLATLSSVSFDKAERRGRYISIDASRINKTFSQTRTVTDPTVVSPFRDTTTQIMLDNLAANLTLGRILPLKSWGHKHKLSWCPYFGYTYQNAETRFLDDATTNSDRFYVAHNLVVGIDLQYRYKVADRLSLAFTSNIIRIIVGLSEEKTNAGSFGNSTGTNLTGVAAGQISVSAGLKL